MSAERRHVALAALKLTRLRKNAFPTYASAPSELLPPLDVALENRLKLLDAEHARATSPASRRRIEAKMTEIRGYHAAEVEAAKRFDAAVDAFLLDTPAEPEVERELNEMIRAAAAMAWHVYRTSGTLDENARTSLKLARDAHLLPEDPPYDVAAWVDAGFPKIR